MHRLQSRGLVGLALGLALAAGAYTALRSSQAAAQAAAGSSRTEILWDSWGVPHIFAASSEELFYAHGRAQARAHADLILRLYGRARGRAAEYWGEEHLDSDRWVRRMGVPARAAAWYKAQRPPFRAFLDAFAGGFNDWAREHRQEIDDEVERVLPVDGRDVLAHQQQAVHLTFLTSREEVEGRARGWRTPGSNAWAIGPRRSASGRAILVANPHLPWFDLFTWFEVQLRSPDIDAYGVTLVGLPFLGIAWNDHLGWTHTVNTHDGADLYELSLTPDGTGYRFDGEARAFEVERQVLEVRRADGALGREELVVKRSVHGPVVAETAGKALALRLVGLEAPHLMEQYWAMSRARNLAQFEAAQAQLQMPMFTTLYADRDGHILHLFGGLTPVRPGGERDWSGIVPGDTSATLWTGTHPYRDLPRVADPASGWLQNANDPPWTTTFPKALDAAAFPRYMAPRFMHFRAQRSARMLLEDESLTFDEVVAAKLSTRMELADRILDDLARAVEAHGGESARRAMVVLSAWDRAADAPSRGGVLFARFFRELAGRGGEPFAVPWSEQRPLDTPDGLADPAAAAAALARAAAGVEKDHGALDVPWGEVFRLRGHGRDLPANGGPSSLGVFRVVGYEPDGGGRLRAAGGDSFVAVVEFATPVRARALLSYGNASQPGSRHAGDQLELFAKKELRPVWRSREEIELHLEAREAVGAGARQPGS